MIAKLKRRFILTSMAVVTALLVILSVTLLLVMNRIVMGDANRVLKNALMAELTGDMRGQHGRAEVLIVNPVTGEVYARGSNSITEENSLRAKRAKEAAEAGETEGELPGEDFSYSVGHKEGLTYVALLDTSVEKQVLSTTVQMVLIFCLSVWALLLLLDFALSGWVVKPMERAWKMQRQFIADASHDLKTPLTVILSNGDLALQKTDRENEEPESNEPEVERILSAGKRMKGLVEEMLTLARLDQAPAEGKGERFDLSEALMESALAFEAVAFEKGIAMNEEIPAGVFMRGDEQKLRGAVECLLDNACKYAPEGAVLTVTLDKSARKKARILVHNTGTYIPPEEREHLFERFYRGDKSRTGVESYGLGLAIVESVVRAMKGVISIESDKETGTVFIITLPREGEGAPQ